MENTSGKQSSPRNATSLDSQRLPSGVGIMRVVMRVAACFPGDPSKDMRVMVDELKGYGGSAPHRASWAWADAARALRLKELASETGGGS